MLYGWQMTLVEVVKQSRMTLQYVFEIKPTARSSGCMNKLIRYDKPGGNLLRSAQLPNRYSNIASIWEAKSDLPEKTNHRSPLKPSAFGQSLIANVLTLC